MKFAVRRMKPWSQRVASELSHRRGSFKSNPYPLWAYSRRTFSNHANYSRPFPLRVAIIGSGPAGFYAARRLQTLLDDVIIDMYEQLPTPFGLVRYGVAPDHPEVKVSNFPLY
jgi:hypothetical protein